MCCSLDSRMIWWSFLFFLSGFALLGVGIWTPVDDRVFDAVTAFRPNLMDEPAAWRGWIGGLIALGSWSIIVGILGMAGAACSGGKERASMIAFAVLGSLGCIGCIVLGSLAAAGFATEDETSFLTTLDEELKVNYFSQDKADETDFITAWNRYQIDEQCCGAYNFTSYQLSAYTNTTLGTEANVPWSCCMLLESADTYYPLETDVRNPTACSIEANFAAPTTYNELHQDGCGSYMWDRFRQWQIVVLSIAWTATFIQIVALILSQCLKNDD